MVEELGEKAFRKLQQEYSTETVYQKWNRLLKNLLHKDNG